MKILLILLFLAVNVFAKEPYYANIEIVPDEIKEDMLKAGSYKKGCPVPIKNLRYLTIYYLDNNNKTQIGEMIVHKKVAADIAEIFGELYELGFNIEKMNLIERYDANDTRSMSANNTSAFNCRLVPGTKSISRHAYGTAIDINPFVNPFINKGKLTPVGAEEYRNRNLQEMGMIKRDDIVYRAFKKRGWKWGGDWNTMKDYQHFFKR